MIVKSLKCLFLNDLFLNNGKVFKVNEVLNSRIENVTSIHKLSNRNGDGVLRFCHVTYSVNHLTNRTRRSRIARNRRPCSKVGARQYKSIDQICTCNRTFCLLNFNLMFKRPTPWRISIRA